MSTSRSNSGAREEVIQKIKDFEKIAAGEVIERPVSVVKELVENSIDAGATRITITLKNAGKSLIEVSDNGKGIPEDQVEIAFERHTTSKIRQSEDLDNLYTLGFRGEALASIAAVSQLTIITRPASQDYAIRMKLEAGKKTEFTKTGGPIGTTIQVMNLFFNLPVRRKFLKSNKVELGHITDLVGRYCLAYPLIHFKLIHNDLMLINSPNWKGPVNKAENEANIGGLPYNTRLILPLEAYKYKIETIYGKRTAEQMFAIEIFNENTRLYGYIGSPELSRSKRSASSIFVNKRLVIHNGIMDIIQNAYKDYLMRNKFPFYVLFLDIPPNHVDCNLHPSKKVIKFLNEEEFLRELEILLRETISKFFKEHSIRYSPFDGDIPESSPGKETQIGPDTIVELEKEYSEQNKKVIGASHEMLSIGSHQRRLKPMTAVAKQGYSTAHRISSPSESIQTRFKLKKSAQESRSLATRNVVKEDISSLLTNPLSSSYSHNDHEISLLNELEHSKFIKTARLPPLFHLNSGIQAGKLYLIFQNDEGLIIIDQHAAHERINYEKMTKIYNERNVKVQELIAPIKLEVPKTDVEFVKASLPKIKEFGFLIEHFTSNIFLIRTIPSFLKNLQGSQQFIIDTCLELIEKGKSDSFDNAKDEIIKYMACHMSIVRGDEIFNENTFKKLIHDLDACENPFHCAHGRPTFLIIRYKDIDKWFHRT